MKARRRRKQKRKGLESKEEIYETDSTDADVSTESDFIKYVCAECVMRFYLRAIE